MPEIKIRRPVTGDIEALQQFFTFVLTDTYRKEGLADRVPEMKKEIQDKVNLVKEDLESNGEKRYFLIAFDDEKIVGTIEYGSTSQLVIECTDGELNGIPEVGTVFVRPEYQKQGMGTLLLSMIYLTFLNRNIKEFCLDSGYPHAQKVWEKKFGAPAYLLKDFWGAGFHHMVWKKLTGDLPIVFRI